MGRIKSTLVKRTSKNLLQEGHVFNESFDHNKKLLGSKMPSKKIRNKIAGYISRLIKIKRLFAEKEEKRKRKAEQALLTAKAPEYDMQQVQF